MIFSSFKGIEISAMAAVLPTNRIDIESCSSIFDEETVSKFSDITGVKSIYRSKPEQTASDLGFEAAKSLIDRKTIISSEIDNLIFVTGKPDYRVPSSAHVIHKRLNLKKECMCFEINLGCSGFVNGLLTAYSLLSCSDSSNVLLITGDTSARTINPKDKSSFLLFGDCGTATLVEKSHSYSGTYFAARSDGSRFKSIIIPAGGFRNINASKDEIFCSDNNYRTMYNTYMQGLNVFNFTISDVPRLIKDFMNELKTTVNHYDCFVFHQANYFILKQLLRKLKIPMEKFHLSIDRYGNTSSNTIPLVIVDRYSGQINKKFRLLLSGFGIGLSWGCVDICIDTSNVFPIFHSDNFYRVDYDNMDFS